MTCESKRLDEKLKNRIQDIKKDVREQYYQINIEFARKNITDGVVEETKHNLDTEMAQKIRETEDEIQHEIELLRLRKDQIKQL